MAKTIQMVEEKIFKIYHQNFDLDISSKSFTSDSLVASACRLAKETNAKAIIGMTNSGYTALQIASHRPEANIFIFTGNRPLLNTMNLIWGVRAIFYDKYETTDETFDDVQSILLENNYIKKGDIFINLASMPIGKKQRTNTLKLSIAE